MGEINLLVKPNKKKISKLEAIRGFAAVYVVLHHLFAKGLVILGKDISMVFKFGQEAVILFFFLSGFVIQYAYASSQDKSFKTFFKKRFFRIYIPLITIFIANYMVAVLTERIWLPINWGTLIGNFLMLQDNSITKPNVICDTFMGNLPLWSLSYEWWFYMLFIFLELKIKKNLSFIVYTISILAGISYLIYPNFINRELMYFSIWRVGADMAVIYLDKKTITFKSLTLPFITIFLSVIILFVNVKLQKSNATIGVSPFLELRHFSFALFCMTTALLWKKFNWFGFNNTVGLFRPISSISFGIYISHWFIIANAHYLDNIFSNRYLLCFTYLFFCFLFSYLVERVIYVKLNRLIINKFSIKQL